MPIQGFTRNRKWTFGKETTHGTPVAATRALPWGGTLDVNPNWTDVEGVDMGSIDQIILPYRVGEDVTATLEGPVTYDDLPLIYAAALRGGQTPSGGGVTKTWNFTSLSTTPTTLDEFTTYWSDDVTADGWRAKDGIIESVTFSFDEDLGPWQVSTNWRWAYADPRVVPNPSGLLVSSNLPLAFGADTQLYVDSVGPGGSTLFADVLRRGSVTIENTIDIKRYASGSNSRFSVAGWGLSERAISFSLTFEKQANWQTEFPNLLSDPATPRFFLLRTTGGLIPGGGGPNYSWEQRFGGTWRTRSDDAVGGNSVVTMEGVGRYDATSAYIYSADLINTRSAVP